jgi:hypothetical protein
LRQKHSTSHLAIALTSSLLFGWISSWVFWAGFVKFVGNM